MEKIKGAQQHFAQQTNINKIIEKVKKKRMASDYPERIGQYLDVSNAPDYHTAMNRICQANSLFQELPGKVRLRFKNDPHELMEFIMDNKNKKEAVELGLLKPDTVLDTPVEPKPQP